MKTAVITVGAHGKGIARSTFLASLYGDTAVLNGQPAVPEWFASFLSLRAINSCDTRLRERSDLRASNGGKSNAPHCRRQRQDAGGLLLPIDGASGLTFRPAIPARSDAEADARIRRILRQISDGLPQGVSRQLARTREAFAIGPRLLLNYFGVDASQPLSEWRRKGWIHPVDPRGWFHWYCRYYRGRRLPAEDARQIGR